MQPSAAQRRPDKVFGLRLIERDGLYCPAPIVLFSDGGRVLDYNLAFEELSNGDAELHRGMDIRSLTRQHAKTGDTTSFNAALRLAASSAYRAIDDNDVGYKTYRTVASQPIRIPRPGVDQRAKSDWLFYLPNDNNISDETHWIRWRKRVDHELTWERYARSYDVILLRLPYYLEVLQRHVTAMERCSNVLDLGAGTGNLSFSLLEKGINVTAVEISRAMLNRLVQKRSEDDKGQLQVFLQDAQRLPQVGSDTYDGVSILLSLYDMEKPFDALGEALRVLKPGGRIIVTEPKRCFRLAPILDRAKQTIQASADYPRLRKHWQDVFESNLTLNPECRKSRLHLEDIDVRLRLRDFRIVEQRDSHFGNCATLVAEKNA